MFRYEKKMILPLSQNKFHTFLIGTSHNKFHTPKRKVYTTQKDYNTLIFNYIKVNNILLHLYF
ncbi:hypothetical protein ACS0TY_036397 [Phlomoides rotata]